MKLDVYNPANTTLQGTLSEAYGIGFLDDLLIPGSARFSVDVASSADTALLQPRRIVRFRTGANPGSGDVFAAIVQDRPSSLGDVEPMPGEMSVVNYQCPGILALLGHREGGATLWPYRGLDGRMQNPRAFGWYTPDFDDSAWTQPALAGAVQQRGWPDPDAIKFENAGGAARSLYRRYMPPAAGAAGPARLFVVAAANVAVTVYLDSEVLLTKEADANGIHSVDVAYEDIEHLVAVEVSGGVGHWAMTWMELVEATDEDGKIYLTTGSTLRRTFDPAEFPDADSDWEEYAAGDYPGVTVGYVMDVALTEANARGHVPAFSWDFTDSLDSAGSAWATQFTRTFPIQPLGRLLDVLTSVEGEAEMTPAATLRYFKERGTDRTASVTVTSPYALSLTGRGPQATRWIFETEGGFGTIVDSAAETALGVRMEQFVQLGSDVDPDAIRPSLTKQLTADGGVLDEVDVDLPDDVEPYVDVFLGDKVMCQGRDGTSAVRLTSFECRVDDDNDSLEWSATAVPA